MTRDYNKPRRDDVRPFSRNQPIGRQRDVQPPRPPRARLNRESVDRAWESGAPINHADYRPRNGRTQPPRNNWRNNQSSGHSSAHYDRKPFGNREENFRRTEHSSNGYSNPRSFDSDRRSFHEQRPQGPRRYPDGPRDNGERPPYHDTRQPRQYEQRAPYRGNAQDRGYQRRDDERFDRPQRNFERPARPFERDDRSARGFERPTRPFERDNRPQRNFERPARPFERDDRSVRGFEASNRYPREFERTGRPQRNSGPKDRPDYNASQPDTRNPRWRSRHMAHRNSSYPEQREEPGLNRLASPSEQFEGDYERFDAPEHRRQPEGRRFRDNDGYDRPPFQSEEPQVTRLPDGRVLKGPRRAQRKNAEFWTDIAQETGNLVEHAVAMPADEVAEQPATEVVTKEDWEAEPSTQSSRKAEAPRKPRTRAASAVIREKKGDSQRSAAKIKGRSNSLKPSKRGFKWPTP